MTSYQTCIYYKYVIYMHMYIYMYICVCACMFEYEEHQELLPMSIYFLIILIQHSTTTI